MASKNRWYVIRPFKLNSGDITSGRYLTAKEIKEIPEHLFRVLVRGVRLYDMDGETDTAWTERNKHKLRLKSLADLGTPEATKISDLIINRLAENRLVRFKSPREKALAEEIKSEISSPIVVVEEPALTESSLVDSFLGDEELPQARVKTKRRRKS